MDGQFLSTILSNEKSVLLEVRPRSMLEPHTCKPLSHTFVAGPVIKGVKDGTMMFLSYEVIVEGEGALRANQLLEGPTLSHS